jgi:hypothetical protein
MILPWVRSIGFAWATLLVLALGVEKALMILIGPMVSASWIATVHLFFDCATLTASGWVAGRFMRTRPFLAATAFALTLCFGDFNNALALNVPWLLRLMKNSFGDPRFLDSLLASVETHALLFGCLIAGAGLSRPSEKPLSIKQENL